MRLREVRRGSDAVRLQEQPFQLLALMLDRPGDVVTREDIRQRLWPDGTSVDFEHSVNAVVKRLRPSSVTTRPNRASSRPSPAKATASSARSKAAGPAHANRRPRRGRGWWCCRSRT